MEQITTQMFKSKCGKAKTFIENDMPIGSVHDYLMEIKGDMVDRMVQAHRQELEVAEQMKKQEEAQTEPQEPCSA